MSTDDAIQRPERPRPEIWRPPVWRLLPGVATNVIGWAIILDDGRNSRNAIYGAAAMLVIALLALRPDRTLAELMAGTSEGEQTGVFLLLALSAFAAVIVTVGVADRMTIWIGGYCVFGAAMFALILLAVMPARARWTMLRIVDPTNWGEE